MNRMMRNKTKFSRGMLERCGGAWVPAGSTLVQWWAVTPVAPRALWCRCHVPHTTRCPAPPPAVPDWRDIRVGRRVNMYDGPDLAPHGDNVGGFEMRRIFSIQRPSQYIFATRQRERLSGLAHSRIPNSSLLLLCHKMVR